MMVEFFYTGSWTRIKTGLACLGCGSAANLYERWVEDKAGEVSYEIQCAQCQRNFYSLKHHLDNKDTFDA